MAPLNHHWKITFKFFFCTRTFLDARNSMALATWKAALTTSVMLYCLSGSSVGGSHIGLYISLFFLKNCNMFPCGQYSIITQISQYRPRKAQKHITTSKVLKHWKNTESKEWGPSQTSNFTCSLQCRRILESEAASLIKRAPSWIQNSEEAWRETKMRPREWELGWKEK